MEWTYSLYTGVNGGICVGLGVIIFIGVFAIFVGSKKGREFVTDRIIGVNPKKAEDKDDIENMNGDDDDDDDDMNKVKMRNKIKDDVQNANKTTKCYVNVINVCFCLLAILTLTIAAILIFQGCILANARVLRGDTCPENPMDCFVLNGTSYTPLSDNITFRCYPNNNTQFPDNLTDSSAQCYGWIIGLQTTKNVLDQLGICTGLIGLFTTLLAIIVYLGKTIKTLVLCSIFIGCCVVAIILLIVYKYSFSLLTHAVLALGAALGVFGLILYCVLPKRKKGKPRRTSNPSNINKANVSSIQNSSSATSRPTQAPAHRTKFLERSSKVAPK